MAQDAYRDAGVGIDAGEQLVERIKPLPKATRTPSVIGGIGRLGEVYAVQGRYDIVCPAESAYQLHQAWPKSTLIIAPNSGHSALEPEITHHLTAATRGHSPTP